MYTWPASSHTHEINVQQKTFKNLFNGDSDTLGCLRRERRCEKRGEKKTKIKGRIRGRSRIIEQMEGVHVGADGSSNRIQCRKCLQVRITIFIWIVKQIPVKPLRAVLLYFVSRGSSQMLHVLHVLHPGEPLRDGKWRLVFLHIGEAEMQKNKRLSVWNSGPRNPTNTFLVGGRDELPSGAGEEVGAGRP